ncbi:MAG: hypothetical protein AB7P20_00485 [Rhizobiaceae bacterium]
MPNTARLKSFAETAVKELQFADTPPIVIARTLRLIESVVSSAERIIPAPANDDRPPLPRWGKRRLNQSEIDALSALIAYQADQAGLTPGLLAQAVECTFDVEHLPELQAWQFDEAVRYLVAFGSRL